MSEAEREPFLSVDVAGPAVVVVSGDPDGAVAPFSPVWRRAYVRDAVVANIEAAVASTTDCRQLPRLRSPLQRLPEAALPAAVSGGASSGADGAEA